MTTTSLALPVCVLMGFARIAAATAPDPQSPSSLEPKRSDVSGRDQVAEEVIVTAQKRQQNLQDVPISLTALTGEELNRGTATGVTDALRSVPGIVTLEDRNGMGASIAVRGVGGGSLFNGSSAPIAYYLDSVPFGLVRTAFVPDSNAYDLERVEVLRGPQGTLYGAAALNGVIRVLTKDVDLDQLDFKTRAMTSNSEFGGWNYRADAAANVPIVEDKLGVRVIAGYQDFSGWIDRAVRRNANDSEVANVRVKLKAQPTESLTIGLSAWISRADYGAPSTGDENRNHSSLIEEPIAADYDVYALNLNYDFGPVSLTSSTSYLEFNSSNTLDYAPFCCANAAQINDLNSEVFSEELLLSSTGDGPWRWSIGGLFRDVKDESVYRLPGLVDDPDTGLPIPLGFDDASKSTAIFGEVTRLLLDGKLELTGGLRHFKDRVKTRDNSAGGTLSGRDTFTYTSPRGVLTWHATDAAMIYASYSKGFRSGVLQTPEITAAGFPSADPDTLANYEIGAKTDLFDRRLTLEVAGYFIDWQNVQQDISVPINGTLYRGIVNGPSASGFGADVSMVFRPMDDLMFGANLSVNDLTMDEDVYTTTRIGNGPPVSALYFRKGDRLLLSPKRTLGGFAQYEFPLTEGGFAGVINISARQTSSISFRSVSGGSSSDEQTIGRASFSLRAPAAWDATLFVDNFTNEQGVTLPYPPVPSWEARPRPRTIGLQIDYRY